MVTPGVVPLSMSRLNASDIRCSRTDESPSDSGFAWGRGGVCGAVECLAAACAFMVSPVALAVWLGALAVWLVGLAVWLFSLAVWLVALAVWLVALAVWLVALAVWLGGLLLLSGLAESDAEYPG